MRIIPLLTITISLILSGCKKEFPVQNRFNQKPRTFLWLFPDSTLPPGISRQRIHWWGDDPDGFVIAYLFALGKVSVSAPGVPQPDTFTWSWTTRNDTLMAFPLLTLRDTFTVFVRAVDNSFGSGLPDGSIVRFSQQFYWDKNNNRVFDSLDQQLPQLATAMDNTGANQWFPLINSPPRIRFLRDPNERSTSPGQTFQQPESTFTAATFAWTGTDPDGDHTIAGYRIALNDTSSSRWLALGRGDTMVTLLVPRSRSDPATGEVVADVWVGSFLTRRFVGTVPGLKLDSLNVFYVQARDVAGEFSPPDSGRMPQSSGRWFVRKPRSRLLVIADYVAPVNPESVRVTYRRTFVDVLSGQFANYDELDIGRGVIATDKANFKVGTLVPAFIDPAFVHMLRLYDVVMWYTDQYPSLTVARSSLFYYVNLSNGKVIFTTSFLNAIDPRGALVDFAPIDSVSSVVLPPSLLPTQGDTRIPGGYRLLPPDTANPLSYPIIAFDSTVAIHAAGMFFRPVYKRADARYIYRMQDDLPRTPPTPPMVRYRYLATMSDLRSVSVAPDGVVRAVGTNGTILSSPDAGTTWNQQSSGVSDVLRSVHFPSAGVGWAVGDQGTILKYNSASSWTNRSLVTTQSFYTVRFVNDNIGVAGGTNGVVVRTTNGGSSWSDISFTTRRTVRSVYLLDANTVICVGDSALILRSSNGGVNWVRKDTAVQNLFFRTLHAVTFLTPTVGIAVGSPGSGQPGIVVLTTDAGETWQVQANAVFAGTELRSVSFANTSAGCIVGSNGSVFVTNDAGSSWARTLGPPLTSILTQHLLYSAAFVNSNQVVTVGGGGSILQSYDAGATWQFQPQGRLYVGVVDGSRRFVFLGLPLHLMKSRAGIPGFLNHVFVNEFGFSP